MIVSPQPRQLCVLSAFSDFAYLPTCILAAFCSPAQVAIRPSQSDLSKACEFPTPPLRCSEVQVD